MADNQRLDFWNDVDGVDTLCGTISSLNLINSNPILKQQILNTKKMPKEYQEFQGILEATQELLRIPQPTQEDFKKYIKTISAEITTFLNKYNFKGTKDPDSNGDLITKIQPPKNNIPLIDGFWVSEKEGKFYPYDNFIYRLFNRAKIIDTFANITTYFNTSKIETSFKSILPTNKQNKTNVRDISSSQLGDVINKFIKKQFQFSRYIPLNVKVVYDHDKGGHLVTFVRNKKGTFDLIGAYNNPQDANKEEQISVRYIEITTLPAKILQQGMQKKNKKNNNYAQQKNKHNNKPPKQNLQTPFKCKAVDLIKQAHF